MPPSESLQITNFARPDACKNTFGHTDRESSSGHTDCKVHMVTPISKVHLVTPLAKAHPLVCIKDISSIDLVKIWSKSDD